MAYCSVGDSATATGCGVQREGVCIQRFGFRHKHQLGAVFFTVDNGRRVFRIAGNKTDPRRNRRLATITTDDDTLSRLDRRQCGFRNIETDLHRFGELTVSPPENRPGSIHRADIRFLPLLP